MDPSGMIIGHMNADHQLSLIDYLVVYGKVKLSDMVQDSVHMTDVDETGFEVTYDSSSGKDKSMKFLWSELPEDENIKVTSRKEIKDKMVSMAKYAASKQGYSAIQVKKYPPLDHHSLIMGILAVVLALGCYDMQLLKQLYRKDPITSTISPYFPKFVWSIINFAAAKVKTIAVSMYAVHIFEVLLFSLPNVIKHRVPFPQSVAWCVLHFFEGFPVIKKFNKLVPTKM